jgi:hypothetical protein
MLYPLSYEGGEGQGSAPGQAGRTARSGEARCAECPATHPTRGGPMHRVARVIVAALASTVTLTLVWLPTAAHAGIVATGVD